MKSLDPMYRRLFPTLAATEDRMRWYIRGAMTEDEAESIIMAVEVGMFKGRAGEVAQALLIIANRKEEAEG